MTVPDDAVLVPVGIPMGLIHRAEPYPDDMGEVIGSVRLGREAISLPPDVYKVWYFSFARQRVAEIRPYVEVSGYPDDADQLLTEMLELGVLVDVTPGSPSLPDLLQRLRMIPTAFCLGNSPDALNEFRWTMFDPNEDTLVSNQAIWGIWYYCSDNEPILELCRKVAAELKAPEAEVLRSLVDSLPFIIGGRVAFLDEV